MAIKEYQFPCTIGQHDPSLDQPEVRDHVTGQVLVPYSKGLKHVPPGTFVEMEEAEAERIFKVFGTYADWEKMQNAVASNASKAPVRSLR